MGLCLIIEALVHGQDSLGVQCSFHIILAQPFTGVNSKFQLCSVITML